MSQFKVDANVRFAVDAVPEKFVRLYARPDGSATTDVPELSKTAAPSEISSSHEVDRLSSMAEDLYEAVEMDGWTHFESFAEEARTEGERKIDIKHEHADRYFEEWEERLEQYLQ